MSNCNCKPVLRPRNYVAPICEQYAALLTEQDLVEVARQSMVLMKARSSHGLSDAAQCWAVAFMGLLVQKGWLQPLDSLRNKTINEG